ncbi:MAG: diacylglycerol/lipid kinase family protein [Actinomycetota bacterium]
MITSRTMTRAHLISNPQARGVSPTLERTVTAALAARFSLRITRTGGRDGAIDVARRAIGDGEDLLIVFGGDGLVNEVVNGMAGSDATLAIIPGGTMNVFARNLGIPADPLAATERILAGAERGALRLATLGLAGERYFTFACGCGFDAETAARVEAHRAAKHQWGEPYFYAAALTTLLRSYISRKPFLRCAGSFGVEEAVMAIALMGDTYAYLAGWPLRLTAGMRSVEAGRAAKVGSEVRGSAGPSPQQSRIASPKLSVFILRRFTYGRLPAYALGTLTGRFGPDALAVTGLEEFEVSSAGPLPCHVDGEPLAPTRRVLVRVAPWSVPIL